MLILLAVSRPVFAIETDQFTPPKQPLADIGPRLSRKVVEIVEADRSGHDPERILADWAGHNVLESRFARWAKNLRFSEAPVRYRPGIFRSVYTFAFSPLPASFWFNSPTVYVHGVYLGTDKIDHFFQQGHAYYEIVQGREAHGASEPEAIAAAVAHGVHQEHTYFGTLISGVYSNGDLAANFAGMKFYLNLRHPVRIGDRLSPPLFEHTADGWRLRSGLDPERLLEPFISNHLDESLNPSRYRFSRGSVRSRIRHRCDSWARFRSDHWTFIAPSAQSFASTWFGDDYGYWLPPGDEASIATECSADAQAP